jgi:hypothetical protein
MGGMTAPATMPAPNEGMRMRGVVMGNLALKVLEQALTQLGATTPEGQTVAKALSELGKSFAGASAPIMQQEVKMLGDAANPVTEPTPQQSGAFADLVRSKLGGMLGTPGAAPTPSPAMAA